MSYQGTTRVSNTPYRSSNENSDDETKSTARKLNKMHTTNEVMIPKKVVVMDLFSQPLPESLIMRNEHKCYIKLPDGYCKEFFAVLVVDELYIYQDQASCENGSQHLKVLVLSDTFADILPPEQLECHQLKQAYPISISGASQKVEMLYFES
jgi:hypothetical protein